MQIPQEEARTALGIVRAVQRDDDPGAQALWNGSENQAGVAHALAILLVNVVGEVAARSHREPEDIFRHLERGIEGM